MSEQIAPGRFSSPKKPPEPEANNNDARGIHAYGAGAQPFAH